MSFLNLKKTINIHNLINLLKPLINVKGIIKNPHAPEKSSTIFLVYHSLSKHRRQKNCFYFTVHPFSFKTQMKYLYENGFQVMNLSKWYYLSKTQKNLSPKTIVLTFDDGYSDNFFYVYPILKKFGFSATFFPILKFIDSSYTFPWLDEPVSPQETNLPLTSNQILQMDQGGMEIGSHSLSHKKLSDLSKEKSRKEIKKSKKFLENLLNHKVYSFSYPYGSLNDFDTYHEFLVKEVGYKMAVTNILGANTYQTNPTELRRIPIYSNDSLYTFILKCHGYYNWLGNLQWVVSQLGQLKK